MDTLSGKKCSKKEKTKLRPFHLRSRRFPCVVVCLLSVFLFSLVPWLKSFSQVFSSCLVICVRWRTLYPRQCGNSPSQQVRSKKYGQNVTTTTCPSSCVSIKDGINKTMQHNKKQTKIFSWLMKTISAMITTPSQKMKRHKCKFENNKQAASFNGKWLKHYKWDLQLALTKQRGAMLETGSEFRSTRPSGISMRS